VALLSAILTAAVACPGVAASSSPPTPPAPIAGVKIPMPRLRPGSTATVPNPSLKPTITAPAVVPAAPPPLPSGFAVNPNSKFAPDDQTALARITTYFNSFRTMQGQFVQIGPNGEQSEGTFNLAKPGDIRFHYNPPSKLDVVADGRSIAIRNGTTKTQDIYPLSKTPLRYLLADHVDLTDQNLVDSVRQDPDLVSVLIIERSVLASGKLDLIFDRKTYQLRQWIVTDAQGLNTSVAIYNVTTDKPQDPQQFLITSAY
jgi:outer membrane lipoprotein-sorting protein